VGGVLVIPSGLHVKPSRRWSTVVAASLPSWWSVWWTVESIQVPGMDQQPDAEHRQRQPGEDRGGEQASYAGG